MGEDIETQGGLEHGEVGHYPCECSGEVFLAVSEDVEGFEGVVELVRGGLCRRWWWGGVVMKLIGRVGRGRESGGRKLFVRISGWRRW